MPLDASRCFAALKARDPRFDGLFFVGVESTGIYCRPICPARTPARDRCRFFAHAAAAERAGFRACLRCRPELAPGCAPVDACSRLVREASAKIDAGYLDHGSVDELARSLGVSSRHLRRAMETELGVAPRELAATRRLAEAKRLLHDTDLSMTTVAFAAGFSSVRRFNACVRARFGQPPSALRRRRPRSRTQDARGGLLLRLDYRPPLDWSALLDFLGARAIPGVERVTRDGDGLDGRAYLRSVALGDARGILELRHDPDPRRARIHARLPEALAAGVVELVGRIRALCDLDAEPERIEAQLRRDPKLASLLTRHRGLRVPGAFDPFELAVRAVLGQQVSVSAATTLAGRLAARFGERLAVDDTHAPLQLCFPSARVLARASEAELGEIGLPRTRARALSSLARAVADASLRLDGEPDELEAQLRALPGIGPWTAAYILMRGRPWPDALPAGDLVLRRALGCDDGEACTAAAEAWRPWRAYGTMHLWTRASETTGS